MKKLIKAIVSYVWGLILIELQRVFDWANRIVNKQDWIKEIYMYIGLVAVIGLTLYALIQVSIPPAKAFIQKYAETNTIVINNTQREAPSDHNDVGEEIQARPLTSREKIERIFPECPKVAVAVAKAESGLKMTARNYNNNGSMDCGLFQINSVHKPTWEQCNEIDAHIELARKIYDNRKWSAWCAYTSGKYLEYL